MGICVARGDQLGDSYDQILAASFPPEELVDRDAFLAKSTWGEVLVDTDDDGAVTAVAACDYSAQTGMVMVEYLAVAPDRRSAGAGSRLFTAAIGQWRDLMRPGAFLAEIERPDAHPASAAHGDPERRLAFYHRLGVRALALPYYQPALRRGGSPVPGLLLGVLVDDPAWVDGDWFLEGARLRQLLAERNDRPGPGEQAAWTALLNACAGPVELVDLTDYARIPSSGAIG